MVNLPLSIRIPVRLFVLLVFYFSCFPLNASPPPITSGYYEGKTDADPGTQYFHIQSASGFVEVSFSGPDYLFMPAKGIWENNRYTFRKPLVTHLLLGQPVGLGQGPAFATLRGATEALILDATGQSPYINRHYRLKPLKDERAAILDLYRSADQALRSATLSSYLKHYTDGFRSTVCSDKESLKVAMESALKNLPPDRVEGRVYPSLILTASRALVETRYVWNATNRMNGEWHLDCLIKGKEGWKINSTELIIAGLERWVTEKGYQVKGEALFFPRIAGWAMHSLVSVRPNGSQSYVLAQFSPELDASVSFLVQHLPERPEDFNLKTLAEGDIPRLKEAYPEFKMDKQEPIKIGEREFIRADCQYRFWFGDSKALRYYHLTPEYAYAIIYNSYGKAIPEKQRSEVEKAILEAVLP